MIILFDKSNIKHIEAVLKLSRRNSFYYNDLHLSLKKDIPKDESLIKDINEKFNRNIDFDTYSRMMKDYINDIPNLEGYLYTTISEKTGKNGICGFILGIMNVEVYTYLHYVLIDKDYRNKGYGSELINHFVNHPKKGFIEIKTERKELIKWYNKLGFFENEAIEKVKNFFKIKSDKDYIYLYMIKT